MKRAVPLALVLLAGCQSSSPMCPLRLGNAWTYEAVTPIGKNIRTLKVTGRTPVGDVQGYELRSEAGATELAWREGTLLASRLSGTRYSPPLPLFKEGGPKQSWDWTGQVTSPTGVSRASAKASSAPEERLVAGRKAKTVQVTLVVTTPGTTTETISWFERGVGLVAQEQRTGGVLVTKLNYVSGP